MNVQLHDSFFTLGPWPSTQGGRHPESSAHQGEDTPNRVHPRPLHHQARDFLVLPLHLDLFLLADGERAFLALSRLRRLVAGPDAPPRAGPEAVVRRHHDAKRIRDNGERHGGGGEVEPGELVRAGALGVREIGEGEGGAGHDGGEDAFAHVVGVQPLVGDVGDGAILRLFGRRREEQGGNHQE